MFLFFRSSVVKFDFHAVAVHNSSRHSQGEASAAEESIHCGHNRRSQVQGNAGHYCDDCKGRRFICSMERHHTRASSSMRLRRTADWVV